MRRPCARARAGCTAIDSTAEACWQCCKGRSVTARWLARIKKYKQFVACVEEGKRLNSVATSTRQEFRAFVPDELECNSVSVTKSDD